MRKIFFAFGIVFIIFIFVVFIQILTKPQIHYTYEYSLINLRQIGIYLWIYAQDHNDVFPENLKQIEVYADKVRADLYADIIESPLKPRDFNGPSYIYVSGHSFEDAKSKKKYIIAYENPEYLTGYNLEKINVLYLEGYVDRLKKEDFITKLKAAYEHIGREMPEIKFKEELPPAKNQP